MILSILFHFYFFLLSNLQQVLAERDGDGFGAVGGADLREDPAHLVLCPADAD